jgi:hypothetical protein
MDMDKEMEMDMDIDTDMGHVPKVVIVISTTIYYG